MLGKEEGKNLQLIHSTILYLFSRSWHQRETSFKEYLHMVHTSAEALSKKACVDRRQETLICSFQWNFFHLLSFSEPALSKITLQVNQAGIGAGARLNTVLRSTPELSPISRTHVAALRASYMSVETPGDKPRFRRSLLKMKRLWKRLKH